MWLEDYGGNEELAIAHAIWFLSLQIRGKKRSSQLKYQSLRDYFVRLNMKGGVGKQAGVVKAMCWHCEGSGVEPGRIRKACEKCLGSKEYKTYPIYLHKLQICGKEFTVQSRIEPLVTGEVGGEWFEADRPPLLPFGGILRIMSYVAVAKWNLVFVSGRYKERSAKNKNAKTNKTPKGGARKFSKRSKSGDHHGPDRED